MTEQGLEADARVGRPRNIVSGNGGDGKGAHGAGERQGGNGHGDVERLSSGGILRGVISVAGSVPTLPTSPDSFGWAAGNSVNVKRGEPQTGSGMQQARDLRAEETVEVAQNHEDGTGSRGMAPSGPKRAVYRVREWTLGGMSVEGWLAALEGCSSGGLGDGIPEGSAPGDRWTNPRRGGRATGQGDGCVLRRRAKTTRVRTRLSVLSGIGGSGAGSAEYLEDPPGNG